MHVCIYMFFGMYVHMCSLNILACVAVLLCSSQLHDGAKSSDELAKLYRAMGYLQSRDLIARLLDFTFSVSLAHMCHTCFFSLLSRDLPCDCRARSSPRIYLLSACHV